MKFIINYYMMRMVIGVLLSVFLLTSCTYALEYNYDSLGRLKSVLYDNQNSISYDYDPAGNIITVVTSLSSPDSDGDGLPDDIDNCPSIYNSNQNDYDNDGKGNVCDPDDDNDGVNDGDDNCPFMANADQTNTDGDGQGNDCDPDDDNDSLSDQEEMNIYGTDPLLADTDGDGYSDSEEINAGSDPINPGDHPQNDKSLSIIIQYILDN